MDWAVGASGPEGGWLAIRAKRKATCWTGGSFGPREQGDVFPILDQGL